MKLHHRAPCAECPWRRAAIQGYLGGFAAELYADAVLNNEAPACHKRDHGPDSDDTAFCVGALQVANAACISLWRSPGADEARRVVGTSELTFAHPREFFTYHSFGAPYVPYLVRALGVVA